MEEAVVALSAVVWIPPAKVEVAVDVAVIDPVVSLPILEEEKKESTRRAMFAKKEVVVAFVAKRFVNVEVAEEVAVTEPNCPTPLSTNEP